MLTHDGLRREITPRIERVQAIMRDKESAR